jgi:hypothetical protein
MGPDDMAERLERAETGLAVLRRDLETLSRALGHEIRTQRLVVGSSASGGQVVIAAEHGNASLHLACRGGSLDLMGDRDAVGVDLRSGPSDDEAGVHLRADHPGGHALVAVARDGNVAGELHARPGPDGEVLVEITRDAPDGL